MCKCSTCEFGSPEIVFNGTTKKKYWWCSATKGYVPDCIAEDEKMNCDLYVNELDVNDSEA